MIDDTHWPFKIEKVLRVIPEKRITAIVHWQDQKIIAKVFLSHVFGKINFEKELENNLWLQENKITVPEIIAHGPLSANSFYLLTHYYEKATSFEKLWLSLKDNLALKKQYFQKLYDFILHMHQVGAYQDDLHLKNFLIEEEHLIALDTGSFIIEKDYFSTSMSEENWGKLLAQFSEEESQWLRKEFFQANENIFSYEKDWRKKQIQRYLKKIFRNSTEFFAKKKWHYSFVYHKNYASFSLDQFLNNPELFLKNHTTKILKAGNSCTVLLVKFGEKYYVVKRYNITSRWRQIKRSFKSSRATRNWYYAHYLQWLNIPTAKPIGFYEKRFGPFRKEGYFIMEYIPGIPLLDYIKQHGFNLLSKHFLQKTIYLIKKLSHYCIEHGDMKASNFLVHQEEIILIDLDATHKKNMSDYQKDRERFIRNWLDFPDIKQYVVQELKKKDD